MNTQHNFGGKWTEEKLERLRKYLEAYMVIFKKNQWARRFRTTYVDGFAGTGYRAMRKNIRSGDLFADEDYQTFQKGSAAISLEILNPFDRYIFIEQNQEYAQELEKLKSRYPERASRIQIIQEDANTFLTSWCVQTDWDKNRAVIFLDPYGMQVEWLTIEAIAKTEAIDFWLLFPLGQAVNRLLKKREIPEGQWAERLTTTFGTEDWKDAFYSTSEQLTLFGSENVTEKNANFDTIALFFERRLKSIFPGVARPLPLYNSKNVPIFLLCFATANPSAVKPALNIANHILKRQ